MSRPISGERWAPVEPINEDCEASVIVQKQTSKLDGMGQGNEQLPPGATKPKTLPVPKEVVRRVKSAAQQKRGVNIRYRPQDTKGEGSPSLQDDRPLNGANGDGLVRNCDESTAATAGTSEQNNRINKLETESKGFLTEHNGIKAGNQLYGNAKRISGTFGPEGGRLVRTDPSSGRPILLIIGKGALEKQITIYMEVEESEFSPRIKLGPPGTTFMKPVRLTFPVNESAVPLRLRKRENEMSEWREDPDRTPYLEHDGICALELSSFSDYEMAPIDNLGVTLLIYIQVAKTHIGLCLRVYLAQESQIQKIEELEQGLRGVCVKMVRVYVKDRAAILVGESTGLTSFDPDNNRTVTMDVLATKGIYGTGFIFKCEADTERLEVHLILSRIQYQILKFNIEVDFTGDDFSPEVRAMECLNCNLEPIQQHIGLFPWHMTEHLVDLLNSNNEAVYKLAESICMPGGNPIPSHKLAIFGGSPARFVLDFYQYLCLEKDIEKKEGLQTLQKLLETHGLHKAAEVVGDYVNRDPQESEDTTETEPDLLQASSNQISEKELSSNVSSVTKPSSNLTCDTQVPSIGISKPDAEAEHLSFNTPDSMTSSKDMGESATQRTNKGRRPSIDTTLQPDSAYHSSHGLRLSSSSNPDAEGNFNEDI